MNSSLVTLPWTVLLALAAGYAGYYVANLGIRSHHRSIDVSFGTLVFGFLAMFAFEALRRADWDILVASAAAFAIAAIAGGFWSRWGRPLLQQAIRFTKVSHTDDVPNAWLAIFRETNVATLQLTVKLVDGTWLKSDDLRKFEAAPNGPCLLGGEGDLLLYVTHQMGPDDSEFAEVPDVVHSSWGAEITYIPKNQIARVDLRRLA